jgi:SAM-dependent methyltransferase
MHQDRFKSFVQSYQPFPFEMETDRESHYEGTHFLHVNAYRYWRILKLLHSSQQLGSLLDVGCYPGTFLRCVNHFFPAVKQYGIGLGMGEEFRRSLPQATLFSVNLDPDVFFEGYHQTPTRFPFDDGAVQAVVATEVFEHLYNPFHMVKEIGRVLSKGGWCYLTTNNITHLPGVVQLLRGNSNIESDTRFTTLQYGEKTDWRGHVRFYSRNELREAFAMAGFSDIRINYFNIETWYKNKRRNAAHACVQKMLNLSHSRFCNRLEVIAYK